MTQSRIKKGRTIEGPSAQTNDGDERGRLAEWSQLLEAIVNTIPVGLNVWRLEDPSDLGSFRLVMSNAAATQATGVPREEILGKTIAERYPAALKTDLLAAFAEVFRSGKARDLGEVRYGDEGTSEGIFSVKAFPLPNHCVGVAFENITERKQAEEALRESEDRFRTLAEASFEGTAIHDGAKILAANQMLAAMLACEPSELIGMDGLEMVVPECRELVRRNIDSGYEGHYEVMVLRKDGTAFPAEVRAKATSYRGRLARVIAVRDLTERKRMEDELRKSESHYRLLAENVSDLIWTTDLRLNPTYASPSISWLLGYTVEEAMALNLKDILAPASLDLVKKVYAEEIGGGNLERQDPHKSRTLELQVYRKDGAPAWVEANVSFLHDSDGRPVGILGVSRDTTRRKQAALALRESEEKYRRLVEDSLDGIVIARGLEVMFANRAVLEVLGLQSEEEIIGRPFTDFVSPDYRELMVERGLARERVGSFPARYEFKGLRADGTEVDAEISAASIVYEGEVARQGIIRDITERKRIEEALRESEDRFRTLTDCAAAAVFIYCGTRPLTVNAAMEELTGFTREEILAKRLWQFVHPDFQSLVRERSRARQQGEQVPSRYEFKIVRKTGEERWVDFSAGIIEFQGGPAVVGTAYDITERKQAEDALRQERDKAQQYLDIAGVMFVAIDRDERVSLVNAKGCEVIGYEAQDIIGKNWFDTFLPGEVREEVRGIFTQLMAGDIPPAEHYENPVLTRSGEERTIAWHNTVLRDEAGRICGVLSSGEDITERKRAEEALRESERRYRLLAENVSDVIWTADLDLNLTYISPSIQQVSGFTVEELMSQVPLGTLTPESFERVRGIHANALVIELGQRPLTGPRTVEAEACRKDGSTAWIEARVSFLRDSEGRPVGILGISRDITERKRAEEALRESERRYRLLAENVSDVIWTADLDLKPTYISPSAERMWDVLPPASVERAKMALADALAIEAEQHPLTKPRTVEVEARRKDGSMMWSEAKVTFLRDAEGRPVGILGVSRDITRRKRAEGALQESEAKFRTLAEAAPASIFIVRGTRFVYANPAAEALTGYMPEDASDMDFWEVIHPDFRDLVRERGLARQRGEDVPSRYELKIVTKGGEERWLDYAGGVIEFEGKPAVIGAAYDITERKRAEEELRESEQRFRVLADAGFEGIVIHDRGKILAANKAMATMFGYEVSEVVGMNALDFAAPESREILRRNIVSKNKSPFELIGLRKDGSTFPIEARGRAIPYHGRTVTVAAVRDITDRRQREAELQQTREELESRVERGMERGNPYCLSFRELTVLHLVAAGKADKEIAFDLGISPQTASKHVTNILSKMNAASRTEAGVRALREGLLE
jgi:PAS domain S-box-containing protein